MATLDIKKIQAPDLTQSQYGANLRQQFENIDDNFRKISNHDFIKGDTGTSIYTATIPLTMMSGDDDDKTVLFTEQGLEVVASILQNIIDQQGESVDAHDILPVGDEVTTTDVATSINDAQLTYPKLICLQSVNGISLVDYFYDTTSSNSVVEMTGIYSYDPVIGDGSKLLVGITNNVVFRDERFVKITTHLTEDDLAIYSDLIDTSCTVYGIVKDGVISYNVLQNFPTLYYNAESGVKAFCWNFAGSKTGIIASGPQGVSGMSGTMYMCVSDTEYSTSLTSYVISYFHDPDNISASDYYNTKADTSNLPAGTNVVVFLNYVTESGKESRAFISTIYHEDGVVKAYCSSSNCIQSSINISEFKSILDTINSQSADLAGLYIPYIPNSTSKQYVHMLYGTKTNTYFDTLHLAATCYDKLGTMPSDDGADSLDALQIDYKTTLINGRLGVGDLSEGNSNHTTHKFHVNGSSLFDGEVHIQGNGDECQEGKSNKYAHLFVGGQSGFNSASGSWGLQPGYVYIQSSSDTSGRLYVDKIYPYSYNSDAITSMLTLYGGNNSNGLPIVRIGETTSINAGKSKQFNYSFYTNWSNLNVNGDAYMRNTECQNLTTTGSTVLGGSLVVSGYAAINGPIINEGGCQIRGCINIVPNNKIYKYGQYQAEDGRINIYNKFVEQSDLYSNNRRSKYSSTTYSKETGSFEHERYGMCEKDNGVMKYFAHLQLDAPNDLKSISLEAANEEKAYITNISIESVPLTYMLEGVTKDQDDKECREVGLQLTYETQLNCLFESSESSSGYSKDCYILQRGTVDCGYFVTSKNRITRVARSITVPKINANTNISFDKKVKNIYVKYDLQWHIRYKKCPPISKEPGDYKTNKYIKLITYPVAKDTIKVGWNYDIPGSLINGLNQVSVNLFLDALLIKRDPSHWIMMMIDKNNNSMLCWPSPQSSHKNMMGILLNGSTYGASTLNWFTKNDSKYNISTSNPNRSGDPSKPLPGGEIMVEQTTQGYSTYVRNDKIKIPGLGTIDTSNINSNI